MPRKREPEFYVAISSGVARVDGKREVYHAGSTIVHRNSPLYRAMPDRFKPIDRPEIEQTTAAPGEHR